MTAILDRVMQKDGVVRDLFMGWWPQDAGRDDCHTDSVGLADSHPYFGELGEQAIRDTTLHFP